MMDSLLANCTSPADYIALARRIETERPSQLRQAKVHFLNTFTCELLRPYFIVEGARRALLVEPSFGPYNQLEQLALDPRSSLYESRPDIIVIAARLEDLVPDFWSSFLIRAHNSALDDAIGRVVNRLDGLLAAIRRQTSAVILLWNFTEPLHLALGLSAESIGRSPMAVLQSANDRLAKMAKSHSNAHVFDCARLMREIGLSRMSDPKLFYMARVPFGVEAQILLARRLSRYVASIMLPQCKCLVLDLDNTLWGGVIGEDGVSGIRIGDDYPGNVFKDFQQYLLGLRQRGILLALSSKNNEPDVREAFKHPDMALKFEHFSAQRVNWNDKASSLEEIAQELNIGVDAMAFFDDNAAEREWVRLRLPQVTVIDAPLQPLGYIAAVEDSGAFDQLVIVEEDLKRATMYAEEKGRDVLKGNSASVEEFLEKLGIHVTIGFISEATLPRVAQLISKTNQFNLTSQRHTAGDVQRQIQNGAVALWLRSRDKFGDQGLVGAAIVVPGGENVWTIDTFLLSCRVIGRRIESVLLGKIVDVLRARNASLLIGEYVPTPKNAPAANFYRDMGFAAGARPNEWLLNLTTQMVAAPASLTVEFAISDMALKPSNLRNPQHGSICL
jgi:FkbH-like protein